MGFPVAQIDDLPAEPLAIMEILARLRRLGIGLAHARALLGSPAEGAATQAGGELVNRRVTYISDLHHDHDSGLSADFQILPFIGPVTPALEALALASGIYSRFRMDPRMPQTVFEALYRTWIAKSVAGELAEGVFVARRRETDCGMVTVASEGERGTIGLIAVAEPERRQGLGGALLRYARQHHTSTGRRVIQVVTQKSNVAACRLYTRTGFQVEKIEAEFHFWLSSSVYKHTALG